MKEDLPEIHVQPLSPTDRPRDFFLHEHPASALSWRTDDIKSIEKHVTVQTIVGDQCHYGLVTPAEGNRDVKLPALKPTRFMSNSSIMLSQLGKRCDRTHQHQHLVGNRAKDAAFYPVPLVRAILCGMTLQSTHNAQMARIVGTEKQYCSHALTRCPTHREDLW